MHLNIRSHRSRQHAIFSYNALSSWAAKPTLHVAEEGDVEAIFIFFEKNASQSTDIVMQKGLLKRNGIRKSTEERHTFKKVWFVPPKRWQYQASMIAL